MYNVLGKCSNINFKHNNVATLQFLCIIEEFVAL